MSRLHDDLREIYINLTEPEEVFEEVGMIDHDGMRAFGQEYAFAIESSLAQEQGREISIERVHDIGASFVGGIWTGMAYVKLFMEREGRPPWEIPVE